MVQNRSATPLILAVYLLTVLAGVGLSITRLRWQILDNAHIPFVMLIASGLFCLVAFWAYKWRLSLMATKMGYVTLFVGLVGCGVSSLFVWRAVNASFDKSAVIECESVVVDRRADTGRRRVLSVRLAPCEGFPKGVSVGVDEPTYDAALAGRRVRLRYRMGALNSRWCASGCLRYDDALVFHL